MPASSLVRGVSRQEQHQRMASPQALDVFSVSLANKSASCSNNLLPAEADTENPLRELRRQREDDDLTLRVQQGEDERRAVADEEFRVAREAANEKIGEMQNEISGGGIVPPTSSARTARTSAHVGSNAAPPASPVPTSQRALSSRRGIRPMDSSTKSSRARDVVQLTHRKHDIVRLVPSPATESLTHLLPNISRVADSATPTQNIKGGSTWRTATVSSPRGGGTASRALHDILGGDSTPSKGGGMHRMSTTTALGDVVGCDKGRTNLLNQRWLPQSYGSCHFQSVVKWAEMSYEEALVAQAGVEAANLRVAAHGAAADAVAVASTYKRPDDASPSSLLTTAYCAIIDEVLWNIPAFRSVWEAMRGEIFSAIFRLNKADLESSRAEETCRNAVNPSPSSPSQCVNNTNNVNSRMSWFSRVCGRRDTWFDTASVHLQRSHELQTKLDNIHVSLEKYDLIFDIYDRTADRQTLKRTFCAWKTTVARALDHNAGLLQVFSRIHKRSPLLIAFHGWRRLVLQRKLKSSKDKDATLSAVHDARLKAKEAELNRLQRQLEQETQRLRGQAERESRKQASLVTSHAVEMRELQACHEAKDSVIISLEKIAKRWERLAKTYRPLLYRGPLPNVIMQIARGLHHSETELSAKGPSGARVHRCREELDKLLCTWVNSVLDSIGSKATRIKNTTSDVREGEALMALCKHIISRSVANRNATSGNVANNASSPRVPVSQTSTAAFGDAAMPVGSDVTRQRPSMSTIAVQLRMPSTQSTLHHVESLHTVVVKALYLGTAEGLSPLLLSTCPFASKIISNAEDFLASPHPTAGAWILASLFVCEMLQTFSQIGDPSDVRFGCPAESHVAAQPAEYALMISSDRSTAPVYIAQKRDAATETLRSASDYQGGGRRPTGWQFVRSTSSAAGGGSSVFNNHQRRSRNSSLHQRDEEHHQRSTAMDDAMIMDTESDIDAYLGRDEQTTALAAEGSFHYTTMGEFPISHDGDRRGDGNSPASSCSENQEVSYGMFGSSSDEDAVAVVDGHFGDHPLLRDDLQHQPSTPFTSFRTTPLHSVASGRRLGSVGAAQAAASTPPVASTPTPPIIPSSATSPISPQSKGVATAAPRLEQQPSQTTGLIGVRSISPVRRDLESLPMHVLFRKLRRETRQRSDWLGLARLVTSVVLRYRILDVDAPVKGRVSLVASSLPEPHEGSGFPSTGARADVPSRSPSILQRVVAPVRSPQPPQVRNTPPASAAVPRSSNPSDSGVPISRRSSSKPLTRGGSMFFCQEGNPVATPSSPRVASTVPPHSPTVPQLNESTASSNAVGAQRRSMVKFE
jgi:hypothetical protein